MRDVPVYLFTGFLESGKTTFIKDTIADPRFFEGGKSLIILCEEGEVELDLSAPHMKNIAVEVIDDINDFTLAKLVKLQKQHDPDNIMIEYNGMWPLQKLFETMPEGWILAQNFMFCDATTFMGYNANMRSLVFDKLQACELVVFNRFTKDMDQMAYHKIVRGVSRRCEIAYELTTGEAIFDNFEDPLPYDIEADMIKVEDRDFAIWYRDVAEDPQKYHGAFDVVFMEGGVLHYFHDLDAFMRKMYALLRPGGRMICSDFHPFTKVFDSLGLEQPTMGYFNDEPFEGEMAHARFYPEDIRRTIPTCTYRKYTISKIINSTLTAGFTLTRFDEHPGWKDPTLPGEFTLIAHKLNER